MKGTLREARELLTELRGLLREIADANDPTLGSFDRFTDAIADIKRKAPHLRREIDKWLQAAP